MADAREILSNREFVRRMTSFNLVSQLLSRVNIGSSFIKIIEWCHISKSGCYSWQSPLETKVAMLSKGISEQLWVRVSPSFIVQTQPFDPVCRAQIIELQCLSYATLNCITRGKRGESPWVPTSPYPVWVCEEYYFHSTTYSLQNHMSVSRIIYCIITEPLFNFNLQLTSHSVLEIAVPEFELPPVDDSDREYRPLFLL